MQYSKATSRLLHGQQNALNSPHQCLPTAASGAPTQPTERAGSCAASSARGTLRLLLPARSPGRGQAGSGRARSLPKALTHGRPRAAPPRLGGQPPPASPQRAARRRGQGAEQQRGGQRALGRRQAGRRAKRVRGVQRRGQQRQQPAPLAQLNFSSAPADRGRRAGVCSQSHGACFKKSGRAWVSGRAGAAAGADPRRRPAAAAGLPRTPPGWRARGPRRPPPRPCRQPPARTCAPPPGLSGGRAARPGGAHGRREADPESILGCATDSCPFDTPQ